MTNPETARATRLALERLGTPAELTNKEKQSDGSRGSHWAPTANSPKEVQAVFDPGSRTLNYGVFGSEVDADMVVLIRDDVDGVRDRAGSGDGASEIADRDGRTYVVIDADRSQEHGLYVLECERETSGT